MQIARCFLIVVCVGCLSFWKLSVALASDEVKATQSDTGLTDHDSA